MEQFTQTTWEVFQYTDWDYEKIEAYLDKMNSGERRESLCVSHQLTAFQQGKNENNTDDLGNFNGEKAASALYIKYGDD